MCVLELITNLLSVSQLIKNGNVVKYNTNCCKIYSKQKELFATDYLMNGVYRLNTKGMF